MGSADFRLVRPVAVSGDVAFSRASSGTYWDRNGVLQTAPANALRWTYDPSDLSEAPYALIEAEATNLLANSESGVATLGASAYVSDDAGFGGFAAAIRMGDNTSLTPYAYRTFATVPGVTYAFSVFVCMDDRAAPVVALTNNPGASGDFMVVVQADAWYLPSTVLDCGSGIYRVSVVFTATTTGTNYGIAKYATLSKRGMRVTGYQLEVGRLSSYIKTLAAPVTRAADVIAAGAGLVGSNVPINEPPYSSAATFAQGVVVYDPATFLTYQSLGAGNTGKALTDATAWGPLKRVVNRWLMLDKVVNSQTKAPNEVTVMIQPDELVNTLGLLNVEGSSVTVSQTDSGYIQTKSLVSHDPLSWYDFFYTEPIREGDVIFDGIPPYAGSALSISVINPGADAAIGCCIMGQARTIGETDWGFSGGILSYSTPNTDSFGNVTMVKRDNSKVLNFEVYIRKGFESAAYRLLAKEYTDVEIMIIGAEDYSMTYAYGFLGQWNVPVSAGGEKTAHIEFKGLV